MLTAGSCGDDIESGLSGDSASAKIVYLYLRWYAQCTICDCNEYIVLASVLTDARLGCSMLGKIQFRINKHFIAF